MTPDEFIAKLREHNARAIDELVDSFGWTDCYLGDGTYRIFAKAKFLAVDYKKSKRGDIQVKTVELKVASTVGEYTMRDRDIVASILQNAMSRALFEFTKSQIKIAKEQYGKA